MEQKIPTYHLDSKSGWITVSVLHSMAEIIILYRVAQK